MVDAVLRGVGDGELDGTFERAAAFARVCSVGRALLADRAAVADGPAVVTTDDIERLDAELDAARLTRSASALVQTAEDLEACARRWRRQTLD